MGVIFNQIQGCGACREYAENGSIEETRRWVFVANATVALISCRKKIFIEASRNSKQNVFHLVSSHSPEHASNFSNCEKLNYNLQGTRFKIIQNFKFYLKKSIS